MNRKSILQQGQALTFLIVFATVAIIIISASVVVLYVNNLAAVKTELGHIAMAIAESGAENGILRLLRDPSYAGEVLTVGEGTATITVAGTNPKTIVSEGSANNFVRKVQVIVTYANNILTVTSWREIP